MLTTLNGLVYAFAALGFVAAALIALAWWAAFRGAAAESPARHAYHATRDNYAKAGTKRANRK